MLTKSTALSLFRASGLFAALRLINRRKVLIVTYHRFSKTGERGTVSERAFGKQLEYLRSHYSLIGLSQVVSELEGESGPRPRLAAITIDDGYSDAFDIAFPLLRQYRVPATLFVVSGFADRETWLWTDKLRFVMKHTRVRWFDGTVGGQPVCLDLHGPGSPEAADRINSLLKTLPEKSRDGAIQALAAELKVKLPELPPAEFGPATWDQLRMMSNEGVEMGSHTVTHPILRRVTDDRLRFELVESKTRLEAMVQREVTVFCYPNGDSDHIVRRRVAESGYRCAVGTAAGFNGTDADRFALRRIHTERDLVHFIQATSGFEQLKAKIRRTRTSAIPTSFRGSQAAGLRS